MLKTRVNTFGLIRGANHSLKSRTLFLKILLFWWKSLGDHWKSFCSWKNFVHFWREWNAPRSYQGCFWHNIWHDSHHLSWQALLWQPYQYQSLAMISGDYHVKYQAKKVNEETNHPSAESSCNLAASLLVRNIFHLSIKLLYLLLQSQCLLPENIISWKI